MSSRTAKKLLDIGGGAYLLNDIRRNTETMVWWHWAIYNHPLLFFYFSSKIHSLHYKTEEILPLRQKEDTRKLHRFYTQYCDMYFNKWWARELIIHQTLMS